MPAAVIPIRKPVAGRSQGTWSMLEVALPGCSPVPLGILLVDRETNHLTLRLRDTSEFTDLEEQEIDILNFLAADLGARGEEMGGTALVEFFEGSLSGFLRISERTPILFSGNPQHTVDLLFDEYVDNEVRPFIRHLPVYTLRAAATKFGEGTNVDQDGWRRVPEHLRLTSDMFIAQVVGRSMEPLIPDGSLCVFRTGVVGSRQGKRLLIEKFGETDFSGRFTVKRYTSGKKQRGESWEHERIRLEPLNPEFEAFELGPDEFRVIGEFVAVLPA